MRRSANLVVAVRDAQLRRASPPAERPVAVRPRRAARVAQLRRASPPVPPKPVGAGARQSAGGESSRY